MINRNKTLLFLMSFGYLLCCWEYNYATVFQVYRIKEYNWDAQKTPRHGIEDVRSHFRIQSGIGFDFLS